MAELGELSKHAAEFKALDVDVLGISVDPVDKARMTEQKFSVPFPVLSDSGRQVMNAYGTQAPMPPGSSSVHGTFSYPTLVLIDKSGTIRWIDILSEASTTVPVSDSLAQAQKLQQGPNKNPTTGM